MTFYFPTDRVTPLDMRAGLCYSSRNLVIGTAKPFQRSAKSSVRFSSPALRLLTSATYHILGVVPTFASIPCALSALLKFSKGDFLCKRDYLCRNPSCTESVYGLSACCAKSL